MSQSGVLPSAAIMPRVCLAVALLAVMTMVFFLDVIYNWWMILVIPPVSMAMFALSWWVTGFVDTDDVPT